MDLLVYIILLYNPRESNKYSDHETVAKIRGFHQENESGNEYPLIPHFYISKTGVWRGIPVFLIFAPKHRWWVLVKTASPRRF